AAQHRYVHHIAQNRESSVLPATTPALQQLADRKLTTNSSAAMVAAIYHGAGIGPLPTSIVAMHPELEMLDLGEIAAIELWMYFHRDVAKSARIKRVRDWLRTVFDQKTMPWYRPEFIPPSEFDRSAA